MIRVRGPADDYGEEHGAGDGLEEDVEGAVTDGAEGTGVEREIRDSEPGREGY